MVPDPVMTEVPGPVADRNKGETHTHTQDALRSPGVAHDEYLPEAVGGKAASGKLHVGEFGPTMGGVVGDWEGMDQYVSENPDRVTEPSLTKRMRMLPVDSDETNGPGRDSVKSPVRITAVAEVSGKEIVTTS